MTLRAARETFSPGDKVTVTNHYIPREGFPDHPCSGTHKATVVRSNTGGLTLEPGGRTPWPKSANLKVETDRLELWERGGRDPGVLFLEIERAS